ncbi:MAG TPA: BON domain-containing protein [Chloroflexota bacterium]|nr:BON domain-containing protein [Chloroflexota bacterium]
MDRYPDREGYPRGRWDEERFGRGYGGDWNRGAFRDDWGREGHFGGGPPAGYPSFGRVGYPGYGFGGWHGGWGREGGFQGGDFPRGYGGSWGWGNEPPYRGWEGGREPYYGGFGGQGWMGRGSYGDRERWGTRTGDFGFEEGRGWQGYHAPGFGGPAGYWGQGGFQGRGWEGSFAGRGPRNYQRSDERIREEVCDRLFDHPAIDATSVDVSVRGGEITLQGLVDDRFQKRLAEDLAGEVSGVKQVHNQLRVEETSGAGMAGGTTTSTTRTATGAARERTRTGATT